MKKIFLLLLATVCLLSVFSCEGGVNESEAVSETASDSVQDGDGTTTAASGANVTVTNF